MMEIQSVPPMNAAWTQIAAAKQERLKTGGQGETMKQMVDQVMPTLYNEAGKIDNANLPSRKLEVRV